MADISMCANKTCEKRADCYRYRACPSEFRQAYAGFTHPDHNCFWPLTEGRLIRDMNVIED